MNPFVPHGWSWPVAAGIFVVSFAVLLFASNQLAQFLSRVEREKRAKATPQQIEMQVRDWFYRRQYSVVRVPIQGFTFCLTGTDKTNRKFAVLQGVDAPGTITIAAVLDATPDQQKVFDNTPMAVSDLRIEMARLGVFYEGILTPFRRTMVSVMVPWDETITELLFFQRLHDVVRAYILLNELVAREMTKANVPPIIERPQLPPLPPTTPSSDRSSSDSGAGAGSTSPGQPEPHAP